MRTRCRWCANSEPCPSNTGLRPSCRHPVGQLLLQAGQAFPGGSDQLLHGWRRVLFHLLVGEPVKNSSTRSRTVSRCHNARRPRAGTKASSSRLETPQPRGVHRPRHHVGQRHPAEGGIVVLHPLSHAGIRSSFGTPASGHGSGASSLGTSVAWSGSLDRHRDQGHEEYPRSGRDHGGQGRQVARGLSLVAAMARMARAASCTVTEKAKLTLTRIAAGRR
jgi:hypothetical protein